MGEIAMENLEYMILSETVYTDQLKIARSEFRKANGKRLRKQRELLNLSLRKAAKIIGISPTHFSDIENGKRGLTEAMRESFIKLYSQ